MSLHGGTLRVAKQHVRDVLIGAVVSPKREAVGETIFEAASPSLLTTATDVPQALALAYRRAVIAACCGLDPLSV
jgi:hypothetical protein